jgi:hypothetical protein
VQPSAASLVNATAFRECAEEFVEIAAELARSMNLPLRSDSLKKTKTTQQMKDVGDFGARVAALETVFVTDEALAGKAVLILMICFSLVPQ